MDRIRRNNRSRPHMVFSRGIGVHEIRHSCEAIATRSCTRPYFKNHRTRVVPHVQWPHPFSTPGGEKSVSSGCRNRTDHGNGYEPPRITRSHPRLNPRLSEVSRLGSPSFAIRGERSFVFGALALVQSVSVSGHQPCEFISRRSRVIPRDDTPPEEPLFWYFSLRPIPQPCLHELHRDCQ